MSHFDLLPCPPTADEIQSQLSADDLAAILDQNERLARDMYNEWSACASEEAQAHPNEDAYAYLFKMRRDDLAEIYADHTNYTWRKRDIARRMLMIMGYDLLESEEIFEIS